MRTLAPNHDLTHLEAAMPFVRRFGLAVDCGAHRGIWSRRLLDRFQYVFAIEPHESHYAELSALAKVSHGRFVVWRGAVGAAHRTAQLLPGADNDGQWYLDPNALAGPVGVSPLDDFADTFLKLGVNLLKLDVEGCELLALMGAQHLITRDQPVVIIEENGLSERYGIKWGDAGQWLRDNGYRKVAHINKDEVYAPVVCPAGEHVWVTPEEQYTHVKCIYCTARGRVDANGTITQDP